MPHVVIEEALDLGAASAGLKPSVIRNGGEILKIADVYLNLGKRTALVECVVIEGQHSQSFFVQIAQKDRQLTVRLLPATDPEKTPGVKRLMGMIASQLHALIPGSRFGKTNLHEFLS